MKLSNADRDRLDDYLMNRLEAADRKVVEQLIASDPDWKEAFEQGAVDRVEQVHHGLVANG